MRHEVFDECGGALGRQVLGNFERDGEVEAAAQLQWAVEARSDEPVLRKQQRVTRQPVAVNTDVVGDAVSGELTWQERALCAQTDPEAFFPEKGGSTREAKRVCSGCEVRAECLEYALGHDERFGIWGGLSERERRRLKRRAG